MDFLISLAAGLIAGRIVWKLLGWFGFDDSCDIPWADD